MATYSPLASRTTLIALSNALSSIGIASRTLYVFECPFEFEKNTIKAKIANPTPRAPRMNCLEVNCDALLIGFAHGELMDVKFSSVEFLFTLAIEF